MSWKLMLLRTKMGVLFYWFFVRSFVRPSYSLFWGGVIEMSCHFFSFLSLSLKKTSSIILIIALLLFLLFFRPV
jgi:hypothetical protein